MNLRASTRGRPKRRKGESLAWEKNFIAVKNAIARRVEGKRQPGLQLPEISDFQCSRPVVVGSQAHADTVAELEEIQESARQLHALRRRDGRFPRRMILEKTIVLTR
jgi:hypothetical protein